MKLLKDRVYDEGMLDKFEDLMGTCCFCKEPLNGPDDKPTDNLELSKLGLAHKTCSVRHKDDKELKFLINMNCWSIGDTISVTPSIRELKRLYPNCRIDIICMVPEIFKYNTHITKIIKHQQNISTTFMDSYDMVFEPFQPQNPVFPMHWVTHSTDYCSYGMLKKFLKDDQKHYEMPYSDKEKQQMKQICTNNGLNIDSDKFILAHPHSAEWATRSWGSDNWIKFLKLFKDKFPDIKIVSIGGSREEYKDHVMNNYVKITCINLYNKLSILETLALMDSKPKFFVSLDTAPIHIAGCSPELTIVGIFTLVHSRYRIPFRNGLLGYKSVTIDSDCCCTYDLRQFSKVQPFRTCPENFSPMKCMPTPEQVLQKIIDKKIAE